MTAMGARITFPTPYGRHAQRSATARAATLIAELHQSISTVATLLATAAFLAGLVLGVMFW